MAARGRTAGGAPPSRRTCPAFSATGATGNTTSARSVTALWRSSRLTTNGAALDRRPVPPPGRAGRRVPRRRSAGRPACRRSAAARMPDVSRPGAAGSSSTCHAAATSARAPGSSTAACRRAEDSVRAPASSAPRSPARRGTQPIRAPVARGQPQRGGVARPARWPAVRRPGSPHPAAARLVVVQGVECGRLAAGRGGDAACRPSSSARGWRTARSTVTFRPCLRNALRSRRKTIGDSSSGSNPASSTAGAASRSA